MIIFWPSCYSFVYTIFFFILLCLILYLVFEVRMEEKQRVSYIFPTVDHTLPKSNVCFGNIPNIYVDRDILKPIPRLAEEKTTSRIYDKVYELNGTIFREQNFDDEEMTEFQIKLSAVDGEMELMINKYIDLNFPVSLQETPYGIIVNSSILLSTNQWNTIIEQDDVQKCFICDTVVSNIPKHVHSITHKEGMEKYQPLNEFDLSIIRSIGDNYHCGVCNESFDRDNVTEHFDGKNHEDRMLFATNRASDVMYDFNTRNDKVNDNENENNDCYHFDRNRILSASDTSGFNSECAEGFYDYDNDTENASVFVNDVDGNASVVYDNDVHGNVSVVYDNDVDEYNETVDDFNETNHVSYATMAKKHAPTSEFLDVILYNQKWKVKCDNWHMIITPKANHMYCMVCKKYEHISLKSNHCAEEEHLNRLRSYKFVEAYKDYLARRMDNKLYHCGLCNSLQLIDEFDDHIEYVHKKKPKHPLNNEEMPKANRANENKNSRNTFNDEDVLQLKRNTTPSRTETPNSCKTPNIDTPNRNETPKYNDTAIVNDTLNRNEALQCYKLSNIINTTNRNETPKTNKTNRYQALNLYKTYNINDTVNVNDEANRNESPNRNRNVFNDEITNATTPNEIDNEINNENPGVSDDVVINQYGQNLRVPFLAYNAVIIQKPSIYYCNICDIGRSEEDIIQHIYDINHIAKLKKIKFQRYFGINLIRLIGYKDHCTICNITFNMAHTSCHVQLANHKKLLDKALMNQRSTNPSATVLNQPAMNQSDSDLNLPKVFTNLEITQSDSSTNQLEADRDMNQRTTDLNHDTIDQSVFDLNQSVEESETNFVTENRSKRKGIKFSYMCRDEQSDEESESFSDKFIYVKHKNVYTKISMISYNSLVQIGNGMRYCFVCCAHVRNIGRHLSDKRHIKSIKDCKFIIKYERHLLRQMFLSYHCSICNVIFPRSQINAHITWPLHLKDIKEDKKTKKINLKSYNIVDVLFQNESIYLKENEPVPKVLLKIDIKPSEDLLSVEKKNKIIICNENVLKISWDSWHSLRKNKNGFQCVLCQSDVKGFDVGLHIRGDYHSSSLKSFERKYLPCLIRKVNESIFNCVICNVELSSKDYIISEHINGKKHKKQYEGILIDSSAVESYADCIDDILNL